MEKIIIYEELTNFSYSDITKMEFLDRGTYGFVYKLIIKDTEVRYALKKMDLIIGEKYYNEKENEIKGEIKILHLISTNIKKPKAIPKFYGYFIIKDQQINQISYCLVFELKEGSLRGLIEERRKSNQKFTLDELHTTMRWLVNIMSYLQLNLITHRDLKPGNILYSDLVENQGKIQYKSLTLIDFGGSKCLLHYNNSGFDDNTLILTKRYCSPELMFFSVIEKKEKANFNPFKSDVFSMGLLILEMGTLQLPFENRKALNPKEYFEELEKENVRLLEFLVFCYDKFAKKSNDNREKLNEIRNILKKSLTYKFEKRPDFLELFFELNKIEKKDQNNKEIILQKVIEQDKKFFHGFNMDEEKICNIC